MWYIRLKSTKEPKILAFQILDLDGCCKRWSIESWLQQNACSSLAKFIVEHWSESTHTHKWKKSAILTATTNLQGTNTYISGARRVAIYFWHNSFSEQVNRRFVSNILTATTNYQHMHAYLEIVTLQSWAGDLKPKRSYRNATPGLLQGSQHC